MRVLLHSIAKEREKGRVRMVVQFGDEPPKQFLGELSDPSYCTVEQELFMRLSSLGFEKYHNCALYQFEVMGIIKAFLSDAALPPFPIELGNTDFFESFTRPTRRSDAPKRSSDSWNPDY